MTICFANERRKTKAEFNAFLKGVLSCAHVLVYKNGELFYKVVDKEQSQETKEHRKRFLESERKIKELQEKTEKRKKATMKARTPEMVERIKLKNIKIVNDFFNNKNNPDVFEVARRIKCVSETIYAIQRTGVLPKRYATQLQREISPKLKEV